MFVLLLHACSTKVKVCWLGLRKRRRIEEEREREREGGEFALAWQRMRELKAKTVGNGIELKRERE